MSLKKIRKAFIIFGYSFYFAFVIGLFLHTSAHPQVFGKYTISYVILLGFLTFFYPFFIYFLFFISKDTIMIHKKKKYIFTIKKKVIFFIVCLLLFLTPVEIYLRYKYARFEQTTYRYTWENFHPFLQYVPTWRQNLHINSWGFRGDEIKKEKSPNTFRIFVLGGSTVYNSAVVYEQSAPKLLQDQLQKKYPDKKIEVINAGVDAYTTEHAIIQYLFYIKDFSPDLIIMWHGINDWYYSCNPKKLAYTEYKPDYSHYWGADASMAYEHFSPAPLLSFHSITLDKFITFLKDNWYSDIIYYIASTNKPLGIYTKKHPLNTYEMSFSSLPSYKRNIQSFINAVSDDHVPLILGNQANLYKESITDDEQKVLTFPTLICQRDDGSYPSFHSMMVGMNLFNNTMKYEAEENSIQFVDLEKALPKTLEYFYDDVHYTVKGNKKVADVLYNAVISSGYIQK